MSARQPPAVVYRLPPVSAVCAPLACPCLPLPVSVCRAPHPAHRAGVPISPPSAGRSAMSRTRCGHIAGRATGGNRSPWRSRRTVCHEPDTVRAHRRKQGGKGAPWRSRVPDGSRPSRSAAAFLCPLPCALWRSGFTCARSRRTWCAGQVRATAGRFALWRSRRTVCHEPDGQQGGNRAPWRSRAPDGFASVPISRRVPVPTAVRPVAFRRSAATVCRTVCRAGRVTACRGDLRTGADTVRRSRSRRTACRGNRAPDSSP